MPSWTKEEIALTRYAWALKDHHDKMMRERRFMQGLIVFFLVASIVLIAAQ